MTIYSRFFPCMRAAANAAGDLLLKIAKVQIV